MPVLRLATNSEEDKKKHEEGLKLFRLYCIRCHSVQYKVPSTDENAPNLYGIVDSVRERHVSDDDSTISQRNITWSRNKLLEYFADPYLTYRRTTCDVSWLSRQVENKINSDPPPRDHESMFSFLKDKPWEGDFPSSSGKTKKSLGDRFKAARDDLIQDIKSFLPGGKPKN